VLQQWQKGRGFSNFKKLHVADEATRLEKINRVWAGAVVASAALPHTHDPTEHFIPSRS
jgi:hypothetical protein